jgi:ATPase subunit of ABC transporter with duplicated ATPase domains
MNDTSSLPKLSRSAALAILQQHIELMDLLRDVEARMTRLTPKLEPPSGHSAKAFYDASNGWETRTHIVRTLYDEVGRLAVAINLQAL